jgi:hypothetical protein
MWLWTILALAVTASSLACLALTFLELVFIHSVAAVGVAKVCFIVAFALSGSVFGSLLYGLLGLIDKSTAEVLLSILITAHVALVAVVLPFVTFRAFVRQAFSGIMSTVIPVIGVVGTWFAIAAFTAPCAAVDDSTVVPDAANLVVCSGIVDAITARAAFIGVCLVGVLGGFAIVSTPVAYLEPVLRWKAVSLAEKRVGDLAARQAHVQRMWSGKRGQLALLIAARRSNAASQAGQASTSNTGFFSRIRSAATAAFDTGDANEQALTAECEGYAHVSTGLFLAAQEAIELHATAINSRSWRGVLFTSYGVLLSLYCVIKLLMTSVNLLLGRFSAVDPVTRTFAILGVITGDATYFTAQLANVALAFNAAMVVSAIRGFLILVFRLTCNNRAVTAETSLFAFSLVLALYFLGLAVLMRLSLPNDFRTLLAEALGALPYRYYHWWHDVVMLVSAAATIGVRRFLGGDSNSQD